jgi:hypothetical protein
MYHETYSSKLDCSVILRIKSLSPKKSLRLWSSSQNNVCISDIIKVYYRRRILKHSWFNNAVQVSWVWGIIQESGTCLVSFMAACLRRSCSLKAEAFQKCKMVDIVQKRRRTILRWWCYGRDWIAGNYYGLPRTLQKDRLSEILCYTNLLILMLTFKNTGNF